MNKYQSVKGTNVIPVIVNTYDVQVGVAELLVKRYSELMGKGSFRFHVPFNDRSTLERYTCLSENPDVFLVETGPSIHQTMTKLLDGIPPEEPLFWAIDDRVPLLLEKVGFSLLWDYFQKNDNLTGLKFAFCNNNTSKTASCSANPLETLQGLTFFNQERKNFLSGFWNHHFVRASVLKQFFTDDAFSEFTVSQYQKFWKENCMSIDWGTIIVTRPSSVLTITETIIGRNYSNRPKLRAGIKKMLRKNQCKLPNY